MITEKEALENSVLSFIGIPIKIESPFGYTNLVTFQIEKPLKNIPDNKTQITVRTPTQDSACGYHFDTLTRYLIHATGVEDQKELDTGLCHGNRNLGDKNNSINVYEMVQNKPQIEIIPSTVVRYGDSFTIHVWLDSYNNKPDEQRYFINVLDQNLQQVDSTLWFARQDFEYEFDTANSVYDIKEGTYRIEVERGEDMSRTGIIETNVFIEIKSIFPSPLKQFKSGIANSDIKCKEGLELVIKSRDGSPACVKPETKTRLIERGWAKQIIKTNSQSVFLEGFQDSYKINDSIKFTLVFKEGQKCGTIELSLMDTKTSEFVNGIGFDDMCDSPYLSEDLRISIPYQGENSPFKIDKIGSYKIVITNGGEVVLEKEFVVKSVDQS
jgi:hypothetical protein